MKHDEIMIIRQNGNLSWRREVAPRITRIFGSLQEDVRKNISNSLRTARRHIQALSSEIKRLEEKLQLLREEEHHRATFAFPDILPIPEADPVAASLDGSKLPNSSGIYFVWRHSQLIYIGKSNCIQRRATTTLHHIISPGDGITWLQFKESELNFVESLYIGIARPAYNFGGKQRSDAVTLNYETMHCRNSASQ